MGRNVDTDHDVLRAAKGPAAQRRKAAGRVLPELARTALAPKRTEISRNGVPLFPVKAGSKMATLALVNRLRDGPPMRRHRA